MGAQKCPVFNLTHVARVAIGPFALSGLCGRDATHLQLETRYIWKVIVDKNAQVGSTPFFSLRPSILDRVSVIVDR